LTADLLQSLRGILPSKAILTGDADKAPFETDWRQIHRHPAICVVLPENTEQVAAIVKLCGTAGVAIVPQGGNTGLVAGGVPVPDAPQIVLSLKRMNKIRNFDPIGGSIIAEAGVTLLEVQNAAAAGAKMFPVSLAAEGTAQIGGAISTNAGGIQVLSYGSMRRHVLGLEVVLADGRIWNGLRSLRKDNTGFDLKQLFIGGEGLLGIITAASLALSPAIVSRSTALAGVASLDAALELFRKLRARAGDAMTMCEFISSPAMDLSLAHITAGRRPLNAAAYVLVEFSAHTETADTAALLETALESALTDAIATDVIIAQNERERAGLIRIRETIPDAELSEGGAVKHDISVPIALIPETIRAIEALIAEKFPDCRPNIFGHLGDGNLHVNIRPPPGQTLKHLDTRKAAITAAVEAIAITRGGSFSAEHGIGQLRIAGMKTLKSEVELNLMHALKQAFDPSHILNPGKMLPSNQRRMG
jgi:FAD/FMN-containing dehydrogenase